MDTKFREYAEAMWKSQQKVIRANQILNQVKNTFASSNRQLSTLSQKARVCSKSPSVHLGLIFIFGNPTVSR